MKNLTFIFLITLHSSLFTLHAFSQPRLNDSVGLACLPEGIDFTTQTQIDSFPINYPNCTEIEGSVRIGAWEGSDITNLNGLSNLTSIQGGLAVGFLYIGNALLTNLAGLDNLTYIGGDLDIHANLVLQKLTGLENLTSIGGHIRIGNSDAKSKHSEIIMNGNPSLKNLTGLDNLETIGGGLYTQSNDSLVSFEGLEKLDSIQEVITFDPITSLSALSNLTYIGNDGLKIHYTALHSLSGLENLTSIEGALIINGNDFLISLSGLENVASIAGALIIDGNDSLVSCAGLENLVSIYGDLIIGGYDHKKPGNLSLFSLAGLDNLAFIGGNLKIDNNAVLTCLTGLENLTSVEGGNLSIGSDTAYMGGGNPSLISLHGLENISANSITELAILFNNSLTTCDVESICNYLSSPNATVDIHDNATGCNSQQEIEEACLQSVDKVSVIDNLSIHPNPFSNRINIEFELKQPEIISIFIYNYFGKQIESMVERKSVGQQKIEWNCNGLPAGIYFCVIETNKGIYTTKIVKL